MSNEKMQPPIPAARKRKPLASILLLVLVVIIVAWIIFKKRDIPVNAHKDNRDSSGVNRVRPDSLHPE